MNSLKDELNKESQDLMRKFTEFNEYKNGLKREQDEINSKIGNADLKLQFHQNRDKSIIEEANEEMEALMNKINK